MQSLSQHRGHHGRAHAREDGLAIAQLARAHDGQQLVGGDAGHRPRSCRERAGPVARGREGGVAEEREVLVVGRRAVDEAVEVPRHAIGAVLLDAATYSVKWAGSAS